MQEATPATTSHTIFVAGRGKGQGGLPCRGCSGQRLEEGFNCMVAPLVFGRRSAFWPSHHWTIHRPCLGSMFGCSWSKSRATYHSHKVHQPCSKCHAQSPVTVQCITPSISSMRHPKNVFGGSGLIQRHQFCKKFRMLHVGGFLGEMPSTLFQYTGQAYHISIEIMSIQHRIRSF